MRKTIKKTLALLLTAIMLLGVAAPTVSAEGEFKDPATAEDGELLWEVDFNDRSRYGFALTRPDDEYSELKISQDGTMAELITKSRDVDKNYAFVGTVNGLSMGEGAGAYTIEFKMSATGKSDQVNANFVYANSSAKCGFALYCDTASNYALIGRGSNYSITARRWISGSHLINVDRVSETKTSSLGVDNRVHTYRLTVDNESGCTALYVKEKSVGWTCLDTQTGCQTNDGNLYLIFGARTSKNTERSMLIYDAKIFKGIFDTINVDTEGEELISLGDMSTDQTFENGITYTSSINSTSRMLVKSLERN